MSDQNRIVEWLGGIIRTLLEVLIALSMGDKKKAMEHLDTGFSELNDLYAKIDSGDLVI